MTNPRNRIFGIAALSLLLIVVVAALIVGSDRHRQTKVAASPSPQHQPLNVVATFSILGDLVSQVGGDRIKLHTLVGPNGDAHVYQPSPADVRAVANADVVIVNGLGFEGWLDRLIRASGFKGPVVVASEGVDPLALKNGQLHDHTLDTRAEHHVGAGAPVAHVTPDPHAWHSVPNAMIYVDNIAAALAQADPAGAAHYAERAVTFKHVLGEIDQSIRTAIAGLPKNRRTVVTSHDAFGYFANAYGLRFIAPQGLSTEADASPQDIAHLIALIREQHVSALFLENIADPRLLQQVARETHVGIGGTLYSDALSPADGPAATYAQLMRHNLGQLMAALGK